MTREELRNRYKELYRTKPFGGWDEEQLKAKILEKEGNLPPKVSEEIREEFRGVEDAISKIPQFSAPVAIFIKGEAQSFWKGEYRPYNEVCVDAFREYVKECQIFLDSIESIILE